MFFYDTPNESVCLLYKIAILFIYKTYSRNIMFNDE